jgi:hypothetical protein
MLSKCITKHVYIPMQVEWEIQVSKHGQWRCWFKPKIDMLYKAVVEFEQHYIVQLKPKNNWFKTPKNKHYIETNIGYVTIYKY